MTAQGSTLEIIQSFLALKRLAMVGISRENTSFSVALFKELRRHGYDVVPVNPNMGEAMRYKCFARVQDIEPPVDWALLLTCPEITDKVVRDCAEAGIRRVWMHRAGGHGAVSDSAFQFCQEQGIQVVPGECPLMFLAHGPSVHGLHGFFRKITGHYPKHAQV